MYPENHPFSEREKDVVGLLLQGMGNKQIALALGISNRTVEFHLSNIYAKLGVNNRSEAILKLTEVRLRESTGGLPVDSTVEYSGASTENGFKPISRRNVMKKLYYILGGLLVMVLTVIAITKPFTQTADAIPPTPTGQTAMTSPVADGIQTPTGTLPAKQPTSIIIPPHTVNGYTAAIESYYVDASHVIFQVRITGGGISFGDEHFFDRIGNTDLYDENGNMLNTSGGWGPAIDPALYQFEFSPVTLLKGDRLKGQFAFNVTNAPEYETILAQFRFDFDLPIEPDVRFFPKQTVSANGLDILLDSVTITPTSTQIYLCFQAPSYADWNIGNQSILQIDGQEVTPNYFRLLFDSATGGDRRAGSEPYWTPPVENGRCIKSGFPIGSNKPASFTLTIPQLEKSEPDLLVANQFSVDYPSLSEKQAYYKFLEEHGNIYKGPWNFMVELTP